MKTRAGQKIRLTSVEELLGVANEECYSFYRHTKSTPAAHQHALATITMDKSLIATYGS